MFGSFTFDRICHLHTPNTFQGHIVDLELEKTAHLCCGHGQTGLDWSGSRGDFSPSSSSCVCPSIIHSQQWMNEEELVDE